ncbi:MAG: DUF4367 domain-containing protein [Ardenticatenaceae bacterium]|nr:DUF4367 domain-containing protein [Ardenticatenaceae bacterium]
MLKIKRRTTILVLTLLLLVASVGLTAAMMIPNADELLTQALETLETVTDGHAIVTVDAEMPEQTLSGTFEVWGKLGVGPNGEPGLRVEVLAASEAEFVGVTAVTDGATFWLYDPHSNTVVTGTAAEMAPLLAEKMAAHEGDFAQWSHEGEFDAEAVDVPETPAEAVAKLLEYVTAERDGTEDMAGDNAYKLRLVPIPEKMPEEARAAGGFVNVWLRSSDQLPLGVEYAEGALGSGKVAATLAEINTDFDPSVFTFAIPEGATVLQATDLLAQLEQEMAETAVPADFTPLTPDYLPESARPGETSELGGAVVQRFSLADDKSFFVAQGPSVPLDTPAEATRIETVTVRGVDATLFVNEDGSRTLLAWNENGVGFVVGGDVTPEEATAVAESLR